MKKLLLSLTILMAFATQGWCVVNSTINQNEYACNSSNTAWNYTFPIILSSDIYVYTIDSLGNVTAQTTNFSVNTYTQTVTYPVTGTPCATGYNILLERLEPFTQLVAASNQGPSPSPVVMTMSDKLTMLAQQLSNNSVQSAVGTSGVITLPSYVAGDLIAWSSTLNQLANVANPTAVAQWSLSGANIYYNTGNVSTTNTMTANLYNGNINWQDLTGVIPTASINWNDINRISSINSGGINWQNINLISTINSGGLNWSNVNSIAKMNAGGINWPSLVNAGINWTNFNIQSAGINWTDVQKTNSIQNTLGSWSSKSEGTVYQATTDGDFMGYVSAAQSGEGISCYTDSNSMPSTLRTTWSMGPAAGSNLSCSSKVKKNDYYEITTTATPGSEYFIGSGS